MRYLASYRVKVGNSVADIWIRPEFTPNTRESASRFAKHIDANIALAPVLTPIANYTVVSVSIHDTRTGNVQTRSL